MNLIKSNRIESIDILRGVVMVIMALDHVRDYFHAEAFVSDPSNLETTTPILFFTRFITHYCAPVFIFLAGTSAYMYGRTRTKQELFTFLFTRGLWLLFVEIVIMGFLWWFDPAYSFINLQVIWAIGLCMILLSILIYLPKRLLLFIGLLLVFGHNLLDEFTMQGNSLGAIVWYILHQPNFITLGETRVVSFLYPILPWVGVISLGYCFGTYYGRDYDPSVRRKWLLRLGIGAIILFVVVRGINIYGNVAPWAVQKDEVYTFLSFMSITKYPPSLAFLLITLGPAFLFLYGIEKIKNKTTDFFLVFGRVPFFYYVLHVFIIHILAMIILELTGGNWRRLIITKDVLWNGDLAGYGYRLWVVYVIWIGVVLLLYPFCKKFMEYKIKNKTKWWLSYL